MPNTYTTGTINQPDSGSVGLAMMERIRDDVVAHAAWELVEEFTPAAGIVRWYVFKCLAAQSDLPNDFYAIFGRKLADGTIRMFIAEDYNSGTHTAQHYGVYSQGADVAYDEFGRSPSSYVLGAADLTGSSSADPQTYYWTPQGTSTKWWVIVGDDFFTVAFNGPNNGWFNAGAYVPLTAMPIDLPIQAAGLYGQSGNSGLITRNPAAANIVTKGAAMYWLADVALGFAGDIRFNDKLQGGQRPVAEIGLRIYEYNTGDRAIYGNALGKLKNIRTSNGNVPPGAAFGDAYVLQNRLWVPPAPGDPRMWDTGVASS